MSNNTILAPTLISYNGKELEISLHECGKFFLNEVKYVFQSQNLDGLLVIPVMQKSLYELVNFGDEIDKHKDELLENFADYAKSFCETLQSKGYWADYIDPCSGLPMLTPDCNKVYSEVDGAQSLLSYSVMNASCCKILLHPKFGSAVYPASIFTTAPKDLVLSVFNL